MIYVDRDGNQIELSKWRELIRDRSYTTVTERAVGEEVYRVAWLGLSFPGLDSPGNFVCDCCRMRQVASLNGKDSYKHRSPWRPIGYFDREEDALAHLRKLVSAVLAASKEFTDGSQ